MGQEVIVTYLVGLTAFLIAAFWTANDRLARIGEQLSRIDERLNWMWRALIGAFKGWRKTRESIADLSNDQPLTGGTLKQVLVIPEVEAFWCMLEYANKALFSGSSSRVKQIKHLLRKASEGEISLEEAKRLRELLDEEGREREAKGDWEATATILLLTIGLTGLITHLAQREGAYSRPS